MAHTQMAGYAAYIPEYQREYMLDREIPAHKYEDFDIQHRSLMHNSVYKSEHTAKYQSPRRARNTKTVFPVDSKHSRTTDTLAKTIQQRDLHEYEQRPVNHWQSSYSTSFNGWESHNNALRPTPALDHNNGPHHVLTGSEGVSSYARSFGNQGDNPRDRYFVGDGKDTISRRGTTADLFKGTTKASVYGPTYAGFIPRSDNNVGTIRQNVPYTTKDNLIQTYNHNLPKYTGSRPSNVKNDRGPRTKEKLADSYKCGHYTGYQIGSMLTGN